MENKKTGPAKQVVVKCPHCQNEVKAPENAIALECDICGGKIILPRGNKLYGENEIHK